MISSKHITLISILLVTVITLGCILAVGYSEQLNGMLGNTEIRSEYTDRLFDTDNIITVNIKMDEEQWQEMLDQAIQETYYPCDVEINGTLFSDVGIRPKGNTSLSSIASDPDNDRYSFKLEFDRFIDGQTCFGLDKLVLNNSYADTTYMKEALIYDMFQYLGTDASLYNYAKISVNGEYWGVYLALEAVEDSFMLRNFGMEQGHLYKPDSMNMGGKEKGNMPPMDDIRQALEEMDSSEREKMIEKFREQRNPDGEEQQKMPQIPQQDETSRSEAKPAEGRDMPPEEWQNEAPDGQMQNPQTEEGGIPERGEPPEGGGPGGGPGGQGNGANLNYSDDSLDSYSDIWEGAVNESTESDHRRVVTALKQIGEGTELESCLDVDNILNYMAVHAFAVNEDSLSGSMAHNYYLYESGGKLNIIPWDYNLSFGGMHGNDATAMINDPIDEPYSSTHFFDAFLEQEEYSERYHEACRRLMDYFDSGEFEKTYQRIRSQIDELVETDPNAMYTYEEYLTGTDMLYQTMLLRAESIRGQLDGNIPSTKEGQQMDSSSLVDGSSVDISAMGVMQMGGGGPDKRDRNDAPNDFPEAGEQEESEEKPQQNENQFQPPGDMPREMSSEFAENGNNPWEEWFGQTQQTSNRQEAVLLMISAGLLLFAFLFVVFSIKN